MGRERQVAGLREMWCLSGTLEGAVLRPRCLGDMGWRGSELEKRFSHLAVREVPRA